MESVRRGGEQIGYGYDGSLVTSETLTGILSQTLSYAYDNDFAVQAFTYADGICAYGYDNDGLLTAAGDFTVARDAGNGLPKSVSDTALNLSRSFNGYGEADSEIFSVNGTGLFSWSVLRDKNGRITQKTESCAGGTAAVYEYDYDAAGRLLSVTEEGEGAVESYRYDTAPYGTRTYEKRYGTGRILRYDEEDRLYEAGGTAYRHDEDGFLVSKTQGTQVTTYDYSLRGELLSVTLPDGRVIAYVHDPLGRRLAKKVNGSVVEKYLWEGLTRLLAVYDGSDNLLMRFEYADVRMPVAMTAGGVKYYLAYDQVGTLKAVADASGNVVKKIEYDTFGNILGDSNPAFEVPFGFAGGLYDRDTKLVRFGYRDYDPETGRWTAKDPIGFAGGDTDLYGYCVNDPVNLNDPDGLMVPAIAVPAIAVPAIAVPAIAALLKAAEAAFGVSATVIIAEWLSDILFNETEDDPCEDDEDEVKEPTPDTHPEDFENVKGSSAKRNKKTGELWEKDHLHKDHYEVYKNKKQWEKGKRDRDIWSDGRFKRKF